MVETIVGYSGGRTKDPTYKEVCSDATGHAEVVKVKFDPSIISFWELVNHFFSIHDPTTMNRQGPDIGSQYRSVIFFNSRDQEIIAMEVLRKWDASDRFNRSIVTEVVAVEEFYPAEEYHQKYFEKNGFVGCH